MYILGEEIKKKWTNLRDTFHSNRRAYEAKLASGAAAIAEPTWTWWKYFTWLKDSTQKLVVVL